jgi:hypothetical protein
LLTEAARTAGVTIPERVALTEEARKADLLPVVEK